MSGDAADTELQRLDDQAHVVLPPRGPDVQLLAEWNTLPVLVRRQVLQPPVAAVITRRTGTRGNVQVVPAWHQLPGDVFRSRTPSWTPQA